MMFEMGTEKMTRFSLISMLIVCMSMSVSIAIAQEEVVAGATIRGEVIDTSPEQRPIAGVTVKIVNAANDKEYTVLTNEKGVYELKGLPAGRYTISVSKNGYGDRIGRSKVVAAGGEIFDRIKIRKKENIFTFFTEKFGFFFFALVFAFILIFTGAEL